MPFDQYSTTGHPLVDQLLTWIGAAALALSTLANILPKTWRVTQVLARFSIDLRGILTPDPSDDPSWLQKQSRRLVVLGALFMLTACGAGGLKLWNDILDTRDEICDTYIKMLVDEFGALTPEIELGYRTACAQNPSIAFEAAEAVKAGQAPVKLEQLTD